MKNMKRYEIDMEKKLTTKYAIFKVIKPAISFHEFCGSYISIVKIKKDHQPSTYIIPFMMPIKTQRCKISEFFFFENEVGWTIRIGRLNFYIIINT